MSRIAIVAALALAILWQSSCLQIDGLSLVNRCGLWQWATGDAVEFKLTKREPEKPIVSGPPTLTYSSKGSGGAGGTAIITYGGGGGGSGGVSSMVIEPYNNVVSTMSGYTLQMRMK